MIANITTVIYILSVTDEIVSNGTLQKGTAITRIDHKNGFQMYKFYNYLNSQNDNESDSNDQLTHLKEKNVYLITGKFAPIQDGSLNIAIVAYTHLSIEKEDDIPIMKPTIHLLGKTLGYAELTESGYSLEIQVKPYLSRDQFTPFMVNLTHPPNGRFRNALTKAKKNSTVHATGIFFFAENQLYCEILEFQFVSAKIESDNGITVPWKTKTSSDNEETSSSKSPLEKRIALIQQNLSTQPPSSTKQSTSDKSGRKTNVFKIADISKSLLLSQNQQNDNEQQDNNDQQDDETNNNSDTFVMNEEAIEDVEESNDKTTKISSATRSAKKRKAK